MNTQIRAERVYLVGASLAALGGAVSRQLNSISKSQVRSRGVTGARINRWFDSISSALPAELAVVLEAGGNGVPTPREIIAADQRLRESGFTNPVWLLWSDWAVGPVVQARRQTTTNILQTGVLAIEAGVGSAAGQLAADKTHLSVAGARLVIDALRTRPEWPQIYMTGGRSQDRGGGAPLPPPEILQAAIVAADAHNVPLALILALTYQESRWNPMARSHANARGLGQILRGTAAELGYPNHDDMWDIRKNLDATARYLRRLYNMGPDSWEWACGAYRAGPGAWRLFLKGREQDIRHRSGNPQHTATLRQAVLAARDHYIPSITRMVRQYMEDDPTQRSVPT